MIDDRALSNALRRLGHAVRAKTSFTVLKEDGLAAIAALRDVVRSVGNDHSRQRRHCQLWARETIGQSRSSVDTPSKM
jgi:hypothetical protein